MNYTCTLIAVTDMEHSKNFYRQLLGMEVTADFGANVTLSDRLALQTLASWSSFLEKETGEIRFGGDALELYFEETDLDAFLEKLAAYPGISYVHKPKEHRWGQRVVRFYDPDRHIIEVGEAMPVVARRFYDSGMTPAQIAERMGVPPATLRLWLETCGIPAE